MGFPGQVYTSRLPFPSPGDSLDPGIEPMSPALAGGFFTTESPRKRAPWTPFHLPGFLPGESHGQRSLVGYSPWGCKRVRLNLVTEQQQQQSNKT